MKLRERIEELMQDFGYSLDPKSRDKSRFSKFIGVSRQVVGVWLSGTTEKITPEKSEIVAFKCKVNSEWLRTGEGDKYPPIEKRPPVIGDDEWKNVSPYLRAYIERLIENERNGVLKDEHFQALISLTNVLLK
jgi:hypothetical protein